VAHVQLARGVRQHRHAVVLALGVLGVVLGGAVHVSLLPSGLQGLLNGLWVVGGLHVRNE
jgi:hypothetical protein